MIYILLFIHFITYKAISMLIIKKIESPGYTYVHMYNLKIEIEAI